MPNKELLTMIQAVVSRLAQNSFMLKGWTVAIVTALLGFAAKDADRSLAYLAIYVIAVFGTLDAYYLALERSYRALYEKAATTGEADGWGMTAERATFGKVLSAMLSPSVWLFHLAALVTAMVVALSG